MKKNKGFSLIEVMMVFGLLGVGSLMAMKMFQTQMKSSRTVEARYETTAILNEIRTILSNPENCTETFGGKVYPEEITEDIVDYIFRKAGGTFAEKYKIGELYGQGKIKLTNYDLSTLEAPDPDGVNAEGDLIIGFDKGKGAHISTISKKIKLQIILDEAEAKIKKCYAASSGVDMAWEREVTEAGDTLIYEGNIRTRNIDAFITRYSPEYNTTIHSMACNEDNAGVQRYLPGVDPDPPTPGKMQYCNGEGWVDIVSPEEQAGTRMEVLCSLETTRETTYTPSKPRYIGCDITDSVLNDCKINDNKTHCSVIIKQWQIGGDLKSKSSKLYIFFDSANDRKRVFWPTEHAVSADADNRKFKINENTYQIVEDGRVSITNNKPSSTTPNGNIIDSYTFDNNKVWIIIDRRDIHEHWKIKVSFVVQHMEIPPTD